MGFRQPPAQRNVRLPGAPQSVFLLFALSQSGALPAMRAVMCTLFIVPVLALAAQKADAEKKEGKTGDAAYERALAYYEQKNYDACLTAVRPAIKDSGTKPELRILAAHCHAAKKNYSDAVYHLRAVAEETPERPGLREDIIGLLFASGRYKEARKAGYSFIEDLKDADKPVPQQLSLLVARAELAYGNAAQALTLARDAKQSADNAVKYLGLITETRALIALANFDEADISLSYAESMRDSELHALLRANIAEMQWAKNKFPEDKRADIVALYEKITRSQNNELRNAAQKNIERVKAAKAS